MQSGSIMVRKYTVVYEREGQNGACPVKRGKSEEVKG